MRSHQRRKKRMVTSFQRGTDMLGDEGMALSAGFVEAMVRHYAMQV